MVLVACVDDVMMVSPYLPFAAKACCSLHFKAMLLLECWLLALCCARPGRLPWGTSYKYYL